MVRWDWYVDFLDIQTAFVSIQLVNALLGLPWLYIYVLHGPDLEKYFLWDRPLIPMTMEDDD